MVNLDPQMYVAILERQRNRAVGDAAVFEAKWLTAEARIEELEKALATLPPLPPPSA